MLYGMPVLEDPLDFAPGPPGGVSVGGAAGTETVPERVCVFQVQRGQNATSSGLVCPLCAPRRDAEAAAFVAQEVAQSKVPDCTGEWLEGVPLDAEGQRVGLLDRDAFAVPRIQEQDRQEQALLHAPGHREGTVPNPEGPQVQATRLCGGEDSAVVRPFGSRIFGVILRSGAGVLSTRRGPAVSERECLQWHTWV